MRVESATVTALMIYDAPKLDPILVVMQDFGGGQGRFVVECYGESWSAWWGAMGKRTLKQFICDCSTEYICGRMWPPQQSRKKHREDYLMRIIRAVQEAFARDL